ncbi:MAG: ABC transporter substrate-binding protein [Flavobacteriaceae bacterium]
MKKIILFVLMVSLLACQRTPKTVFSGEKAQITHEVRHAKGFELEHLDSGITLLKVIAPWSDASSAITYALIPKDKLERLSPFAEQYEAIVPIPVNEIVVTSTTHIPALEALGVSDRLVGFPDTKYVSSEQTRKRIDAHLVKELGNNEAINTEMLLALHPELVVGFGIDGRNKAYETIERSGIPVVYNGDWTEETPLGKAEWIKFFAAFFQKETLADSIFREIEGSYAAVKALAAKAKSTPTVMSGALYKDIWYLPGGKSWAAVFLKDANSDYLWADNQDTGSLALSWESVLEKAQQCDFWISPAQYTTYVDLAAGSPHYKQFSPYQNKKVYTFAKTLGPTGGMIYYELAPQRPDLVLKDLIAIFHPELLPDHELFFFKPLD